MNQTEKPLVSIVVPVYGVQQYLPACLDSILAQSYEHLQIILVDDGSPDKCPEICDQYGRMDSRILVIHQKNGGVSNARNTGLQQVKGKYVTFCDSDDSLTPDWIFNLVSAMERSGADVAAAGHTKCFPDGSKKEILHEQGLEQFNCPEDRLSYMIHWVMNDRMGWEIWSRMFKADVISEHHICFCETCGNFAEDLGFVLEYSLYADSAVSVAQCGYLYLVRDNSMMSASKGKPKLDSVNEVSCFVLRRFKSQLTNGLYHKYGPIIHFLIMLEQYLGAIRCSDYHHIGRYVDSIQNSEWWKEETKEIFSCRETLKTLFGKIPAGRILIFSRYLLHRNWFRFKVERFLFFKLNHYQD